MTEEMEVDRDDFTDARLTFSQRFRLSSSEAVWGKKTCSIQHLGKTVRAAAALRTDSACYLRSPLSPDSPGGH